MDKTNKRFDRVYILFHSFVLMKKTNLDLTTQKKVIYA